VPWERERRRGAELAAATVDAVSGRVAWIQIAPVKGLGLVELEEAWLSEVGIPENRRFHLIDARGRLVNGKLYGRLVQIRPHYDAAREHLALALPGGTRVEDDVALGDEVVTVFYGRPVRGRLVEGPFDEAISAFMGEDLRLVRPERPAAAVDRGRSGAVSLVSTAALGAIAEAAGCAAPLDGRRFRMLFGVDGIPAHAEDEWINERVRIGEAEVRPRGNVGRCTITSQDPDTGIRDVDTLSALKAYRSGVDTTEPLPFGVVGPVSRPGRVRVGDQVEIVATT
jgi:hypothetical protein